MSNTRKYLFAFVALLLVCVVAVWEHPLKIESDLLELLPENQRNAAEHEAIQYLSSSSANLVNVLVLADDEDVALSVAKVFRAKLPVEDATQSRLAFSEDSLDSIRKVFYPFRFQLLSEKQKKLLREKDYRQIEETAMAEIYAPVSARVFSLKDDPFGFATKFFLENELLKSAFKIKDGICLGNVSGKTVACLPVQIKSSGGLSGLHGEMEKLYGIRTELESTSSAKILFAGVPVHTDASATKSIHEINFISVLSLLALLAIFLFVFHSLKQFLTAAGTICIAIGVATVVTNFVFGEIHVLVLVFGCSLIGVSVDYILHLLIEGDLTLTLKRSLLLSATTSVIAFCIFFLSGLTLLYQIATFCLVGICTVLVCVMFPLAGAKDLLWRSPVPSAASISSKISKGAAKLEKPFFIIAPIVVLGGILSFFFGHFSDDLRDVYAPDGELLVAEKTFAELFGQNSGAQTLVIFGKDEEDVLVRQREFSEELGVKNQCISQLIPPASEQQENLKLVGEFFKEVSNFPIKVSEDSLPKEFTPLTPGQVLAGSAMPLGGTLFWKSGKNFFAPVFVREKVDAPAAFAELCKKYGAQKLDSVGAISAQLSVCRDRILLLLACAIVLFAIIFSVRCGARRAVFMMTPPLCAMSIVLISIFVSGGAVSLFHSLALFLVLGFGADYVIFVAENGSSGKPRLSVLLSCLTTLVAFGLLAFTTFPVISAIGMAAATGIFSSFALTEIFANRIKPSVDGKPSSQV